MNQHVVDVFVLRNVIKKDLEFTQGTNALPILFVFKDFKIPENADAKYFITKPSKKQVIGSGNIDYETNSVLVNLHSQAVTETGRMFLQVEIKKSEEILFTFEQPYKVHGTQTPISGSEIAMPIIDEVLDKTNKASEDAEKITKEIEKKAINGDYSASIEIGNVITGDPGTEVEVTNRGTKKDLLLDIKIPKGYNGESGVCAAINGMYVLRVDQETGNLYVDYPDNTEPPPFRFEATGDLYYDIKKGDGTVASMHLGNVRGQLINNLTTKDNGKGALDAAQGPIILEKLEKIEKILENTIMTVEEGE